MLLRLVDIETCGVAPPAGVCEIGWTDVRSTGTDLVGAPTGFEVVGTFTSHLVDPQQPIPPETSAIHHIVDEDVAGAMSWPEAVALLLDPAVDVLAAHSSKFERAWLTDDVVGGLSWICTYKCALRLWSDSPSHSNQCLRYWRRPAGLDRSVANVTHRAGPDAYVSAYHLRDLLDLAPVEDLIRWSSGRRCRCAAISASNAGCSGATSTSASSNGCLSATSMRTCCSRSGTRCSGVKRSGDGRRRKTKPPVIAEKSRCRRSRRPGMGEPRTTSWVRIVGPPFLERAKAYRAEQYRCAEAWSKFAEGRGASGYFPNGGGLCFTSAAPPPGWSKANRRNGYSAPKKRSEDLAALAALPRFPKSWDIFGDALVSSLSFDTADGGWGSGRIGFLFDGPKIGWAGDTIVALIPNARLAREAHLKEYPTDTIREPAASWELPDGLDPMTDAEKDLLFAEERVRAERQGEMVDG